ncbi:hypothetical protein N7532_005279 [Penicillium argentinense]|uniref:Uncharacterized protein n=1 Tax=Penicillium argentinense TaxID=1131581 RepID=A0A9W9K9T6_9EURO|nr:uncharacterized protein N7532_005279 [Penicillium argentinense]KAJ5098278.1 hypothetical protein N7532_005279 [Penicillium argentinense]
MFMKGSDKDTDRITPDGGRDQRPVADEAETSKPGQEGSISLEEANPGERQRTTPRPRQRATSVTDRTFWMWLITLLRTGSRMPN